MRKVLVALLIAAMAFALVTCNRANDKEGTDEDKQLFIGFIEVDFAAPSVARTLEGAEAMAKQLGIKFVALDSQGDTQKEADNALTLLSQGVDGIIIEPNDVESFLPMAQKIRDAGVPLIIFAQDFDQKDRDLRLAYVGCNDYEDGVYAGNDALKCLGDKGGNIVIIEGKVGSTPQIQRTRGFHDVVDKVPTIKVLEAQPSPWDRTKAVEIMEDYLSKYKNIDLVYCHDDNMAVGAVEALEAAGLAGKIPVIGYNGTKEVFDLIRQGKVFSSMIQPLYWGGGKCVEVMVDYLNGKEIEEYYWDVIEVAYKENVDQLKPEW
jgi:ABC-type sugar transport system substrate-binding protein